MKRRDIARILGRHKGAKAEVSRRCTPPVPSNAVSMWLAGGTNANVAKWAEIKAIELLAKEEADRLATGEVNGPSARQVIEQLRKKASHNE